MRPLLGFLWLCLLITPAISVSSDQHQPQIILFVSIDQLRADYLTRFEREFTGGFRRLLDEGVVFSNADLNYAGSETGPGHASLSTGAYPRTSGILSNDWIDPEAGQSVYSVADTAAKPVEGEGGGFSPHSLMVSAIGDWLLAASPRSKVIAVSFKDRAAVLMGGQHPMFAFWYDRKTGHMVTSDYYTHRLPGYLKDFNSSNWIDHHVPDAWVKLMPENVYTGDGPDDMEGELMWNGVSSAFPHRFQSDRKKEQIATSPYGDLLVLDFAEEILRAEQLGKRNVPDLLCISLSCTDYIGHSFGPNSHEIHDQLLRLDRALGDFLKIVDQQAGAKNVLVALSADHGAMGLPEYLTKFEGKPAKRILVNAVITPKVRELDRKLQQEFGIADSLIRFRGFLNYAAARKAGIDSVALEQKVREGLLHIDGIADVFFRRELIRADTPDRPYLKKFQRSFYPPRGEDFQILRCEYCLYTSRATGTSHGTAYGYDTHVPIIVWSPHISHSIVQREVHTVDIAPTLARILRIPFPSTVEGEASPEIVR